MRPITLIPALFTVRGCERLINPTNGHVLHDGTAVGAHAKYFCDEGFYLVGDRFRECLESGWSGEAPICKCKLSSNLCFDEAQYKDSRQ